jgi:hypothetical protein
MGAATTAHSCADLWITQTPEAERPVPLRSRWGTHAQSYALQPDAYAARVADFLDRAFSAAPPS